jgi:ABC-type multidrug transport system ATPase subunit
MLEIRGLTKSFAGRIVLSGVDLDVAAGEAVALIGGTGSGKTTTLRTVVGLARPDGGSVEIDGIDASRNGALARERLSYLPQRPAFPATLTPSEILAAVCRLRGLAPGRAAQEIDSCRLWAVADHVIGTMSGGERQRLGLAVAFLPDVGLYIFDEPSASLDSTASEIFFDRAEALAAEGRALLFTSHVAADVERLATRTVELVGEMILSRPWEAVS